MPFVFVHEHNNLFGDSYLKNVTCLQHEEDGLPPTALGLRGVYLHLFEKILLRITLH